ncbi:uncharacterized protein BJ171DRAFT_501074 [Polychytrium aggregatum]|uniref:uncharacterized protein n=1 Tax=Polychytrium aggregatum TaxID=110093 RepID=UPI0022FE96CA|nr:uncharacterized protein BJ171DRAFT_501074 [Polychytrium aggregatum]KAI9205638.1 hypothetical protein BJ171DRAFT_501074 [Polychytrium aggregatum]
MKTALWGLAAFLCSLAQLGSSAPLGSFSHLGLAWAKDRRAEQTLPGPVSGLQLCKTTGFCYASVATSHFCWDDIASQLSHPPVGIVAKSKAACTECIRLFVQDVQNSTDPRISGAVAGLTSALMMDCGSSFIATGNITEGPLSGTWVSTADVFVKLASPNETS